MIIVGAGPVGLTLAIDLGRRGLRCILLEQKDAPQFLPKMERCNARTMEIYRRIGIAQKIRDGGFPRDVPMDVFIITSLTEPPLLHLPYPSVKQAQAEIAACTDGSMPLEPYQLISQYTLDPLLKSVAEGLPNVDVRYGCEFVSFAQDAGGVRARVKTADGAAPSSRRNTSSAAMAAPAWYAGNSASNSRAKPICCSSGRRCTAATICSSAFQSARAGITTSPTATIRS